MCTVSLLYLVPAKNLLPSCNPYLPQTQILNLTVDQKVIDIESVTFSNYIKSVIWMPHSIDCIVTSESMFTYMYGSSIRSMYGSALSASQFLDISHIPGVAPLLCSHETSPVIDLFWSLFWSFFGFFSGASSVSFLELLRFLLRPLLPV